MDDISGIKETFVSRKLGRQKITILFSILVIVTDEANLTIMAILKYILSCAGVI
jgi:hypothetical protein